MSNLPIVEFAGKKIKPTKAGVYLCPFGCGSAGYPRPKWKTVEGFVKHLEKCPKSPAALEKHRQAEEARRAEFDTLAREQVALSGLGVGQVVFCVYEVITMPERDRSGRRVRFEPEKDFVTREETISTLGWNYGIIINNKKPRMVCTLRADAVAAASDMKRRYDEHVEISRLYR